MIHARALVVSMLALSSAALLGSRASAGDAAPLVSSSAAAVTVYGATWCSACKVLESGLRERGVPFDVIDIDDNPKAYDAARRATGKSVVPLTSVTRGSDSVWIVGADVDAVEKAYRGD